MNVDRFGRGSRSSSQIMPLIVTGAVGDSQAVRAFAGYDLNDLWIEHDVTVLPSSAPGSTAPYLYFKRDAPISGVAPAQWPLTPMGTASSLLLTDTEDLGETALTDPHGLIGLFQANSATMQSFVRPWAGTDLPMPTRVAGDPFSIVVLHASDPFEPFRRSLDSLLSLVPSWDGLDSEPPNAAAIENCRIVLNAARDQGLVPTQLVAAHESVFVYFWKGQQRYANIECDNDGTVLAAVSDRTGMPSVWVVERDGMAQVLEKLSAYLF